jgi:hypothetical protein
MKNSTIAIERPAPRRAGRRRIADSLRRRPRTAQGLAEPLHPLLLRSAGIADRNAIAAIAALDNGTVPAAGAVLAIRDGRLEAVLDTTTGAVVADPFVPSSDAARMARIYAERMRTWPRAF